MTNLIMKTSVIHQWRNILMPGFSPNGKYSFIPEEGQISQVRQTGAKLHTPLAADRSYFSSKFQLTLMLHLIVMYFGILGGLGLLQKLLFTDGCKKLTGSQWYRGSQNFSNV